MQRFKDYADILRHHAVNRADQTAIYHGDETVSYAHLEANVNRFGNVLKSLDVRVGDRVLIALPDCPEVFYAFLGALKYGARPVLLAPDLPQSRYAYVLRDAQPVVVITLTALAAIPAAALASVPVLCLDEARYAQIWQAASAELAPCCATAGGDDFLLYSSGSTGEPKGVPHAQSDMLFCAEHYAGGVLSMSERDVVLSASKLYFAYGLGNSLIFPLYFGASVILSGHGSGPADLFQLFALIEARRPTLLFAVPSVYNMMVKTMTQQLAMPSLRLCISAGEALPAGLCTEWQRLTGVELIDGIGSSEALHIFISNAPGHVAPGMTGVVVPGYAVRIVGDDARPVASGLPGTLLIRGGSTARSYWNRPDLTARTMADDGWLNTGDVFVEQNGYYTYQGRADDMFKAGGNWVSPAAVEAVLGEHPAVFECAVTALRENGLLQPLAHVVINAGHPVETGLARQLRRFVVARLPAYMCPVQFVFVDCLPKTSSGKVQRFALRNQEEAP